MDIFAFFLFLVVTVPIQPTIQLVTPVHQIIDGVAQVQLAPLGVIITDFGGSFMEEIALRGVDQLSNPVHWALIAENDYFIASNTGQPNWGEQLGHPDATL